VVEVVGWAVNVSVRELSFLKAPLIALTKPIQVPAPAAPALIGTVDFQSFDGLLAVWDSTLAADGVAPTKILFGSEYPIATPFTSAGSHGRSYVWVVPRPAPTIHDA
jgi:hypothetical protein